MTASALDIAARVASGQTTALAETNAALARIMAHDDQLNCFTHLDAARARAEASAIDAQRDRGEPLGPLAGVPFAVKNLFDIENVTTIAGSKVLATDPPATRDAFLVRRLCEAGAVLLGALNMDEFAYGFVTENAHAGPTRNPYDITRLAGGSSGGSAAAVAGGLVPLTLGSDTNGSIRVPASLCGIFGIKPTYGRLSRGGSFPFVHSFDHLGPFARSAADLAAVYDACLGLDLEDPAQHHGQDLTQVSPQLDSAPAPRTAILGGWFAEGASEQALAAVAHVAAALGALETVELEGSQAARSAAFCITGAQGGALHLNRLRTDAASYDPATRARLMAGTMLPASVLQQAQRFRSLYHARALALFERFDLLLAPATPVQAPLIGQSTMEMGSKIVNVRANLGLFTQPISFIGLPVATVPVWLPGESLPIGVQIIARPWAEATALQAAHRLEQAGAVGYRLPASAAKAPV